jgi:hypothetical protein
MMDAKIRSRKPDLHKIKRIDYHDEQGHLAAYIRWTAGWAQVIGRFEISEEDFDDGEIERDGMIFCVACGMLAMPGNEEYDWCDHRTGIGCAYFVGEEDDHFDDYD